MKSTFNDGLHLRMVRFQVFLTKEQHDWLRKNAYETSDSGGHVIRRGICQQAKRKGVELTPEPVNQPTK